MSLSESTCKKLVEDHKMEVDAASTCAPASTAAGASEHAASNSGGSSWAPLSCSSLPAGFFRACEVDYGDSNSESDKITQVGSERTSKSRTSACKSRGVKVRKLEKHETYLKNKFVLAGREMKPWENQDQEYILFPKENVHEETSASDVYVQIIDAANNQRVNMWDMLFAFRDDDFTARKQIAKADLQAIHHRVVDPQEDRCLACKKSGLYGHVGDKQHQQSL
jgi:hypothetical protein